MPSDLQDEIHAALNEAMDLRQQSQAQRAAKLSPAQPQQPLDPSDPKFHPMGPNGPSVLNNEQIEDEERISLKRWRERATRRFNGEASHD